MMEVQNQKGECSNEIEFYFRPDQHLLMDLSCGGSGVCGLSGDQGAQKIHKVGAGEKGKGGTCKNAWGDFETASVELQNDAGICCRNIRCQPTGGFQVGKRSFPNKRILRNNLCLPACKEKNIAIKPEYYINVLVALLR